jgi:hypothetical protein
MHKLLFGISMLLFCNVCGKAQISPESMNAYTVINKAIDAMGGKEFLQSIYTLYTVTQTQLDGFEVNWIAKEMKPNKDYFQIAQNNRTVYQSWYDGKNGFEIVSGIKKKQDEEDNKDKLYKKNIFNELDYVNPILWKIELVGEETVGTDSCYKIKANLINGLIKYLYYSKTSFFLRKEERHLNDSQNSLSTFLFYSYKKFGKLTYYSEIKFTKNGRYQDGKLVDLAINQLVEEKDFK